MAVIVIHLFIKNSFIVPIRKIFTCQNAGGNATLYWNRNSSGEGERVLILLAALCYGSCLMPWGPFLKGPGNLPGPISLFLNVFFAGYTMITDMVLGQCFHRIIRF